jgi:hypothetical protein
MRISLGRGATTMVTKIEEDAKRAAAWIATALSSSGYRADFSPGSLWEVDRFFDEHTKNGRARPRGLLAEDLGQRIFALGAYVGEVLIRHAGATWEGDDNDPDGEVNLALRLRDGSQIWPVQRAMKRFQLGSEESIAPYASVLGLAVGPKPRPPKPRWRFW